MKKRMIVLFFILLPFALLSNGCALAALTTDQPIGILYQDTKKPEVVQPANILLGEKTGTAMAASYLGLIATGDASLEAAMNNGQIKKVHYIDHQVTNILGLYVTHTTIVHGE